jgi:cytidylate kinase
MTAQKVVAIDGAAGSGKSTLARLLARELGLAYINTGLMYRALTRLALDTGTSPDDAPSLVTLSDRLSFSVIGDDPPEVEVEGYRKADLHALEVDSTVSSVARHPEVRGCLRSLQRSMGEASGAVVEGRDIGSVVFPDARVKLYLVADPAVRADRRVVERQEPRRATTEALVRRDARDALTNPFEPPEGAIVLDTGAADHEATLAAALAIVQELAPELLR